MLKLLLSSTLLITISVSCAPVNRPEALPTMSPTVELTATPGATPSSQPTVEFASTPLTLQTPATPGDEPRLVFFVSERGRFQSWMPVSGDIVEFTLTRTVFGKFIECSIIFFPLNSAGATVQYCDLPSEDIASASHNEILDEVRNTVKKDFRWRIDKEQRKVVNGSYPALVLSGEEDMRGGGYDGTFKARIILAQNRVYLVHMSVYYIDWCNCRHQMDQVVDSFYVDPEITIPFQPTP
jgi:hypothetical protein